MPQLAPPSVRYLSLKTGVKHNTLANYNFVVNVLKKEEFSHKKVDDVKLFDAKIFLIKLQRDGRGYSSIHSIRGVLRPYAVLFNGEVMEESAFANTKGGQNGKKHLDSLKKNYQNGIVRSEEHTSELQSRI